jgi:hypothetical protein
VAAGAALLVPLVIHEVATGAPNLRAAAGLLSVVGPVQTDSLPRRLYAVLVASLVGPFLAGGVEPLGVVVTGVLVVGLAIGMISTHHRFASALLSAVLCAPLVVASAYRGPIFEHYLIAYAPAAFLAIGGVVQLAQRWRLTAVAGAFGLCGLVLVNVAHLPFGEPDRQLARTQAVALRIAAASGGERFGIWLLADDDTDGAYRFQLVRIGHRITEPSEPPPRLLFVLCQAKPCGIDEVRDVIGPDWSDSQIDWVSSVDGVDIVRVVGRL